jgi:5-methylcytosine-specific restriction endonuclease McrA
VLPPLRKRWYAGLCACCGEPFIHDQPQTVTCSPPCCRRLAKARRRAIQRNAFVAPVSRRRVFEHDDWTCQLCGEPVERDARVPHPLAPTIDHIVALAVGGSHEPANAQCAHFLCNCLKGARDTSEPLLLSA